MKIKKLFFISFTTLLIFLIYLTTVDKKIYYLNIGDSVSLGINSYKEKVNGYDVYIKEYLASEQKLEKFINSFSKKDIRIIDLYNMIDNNYKLKINNKEQTLKNALIKADIVTLSIGSDELYQKINNNYSLAELYEFVDSYKLDMEKLIIILKKYCKEDIFLIGYYKPYNNLKDEKIITYMNLKMNDLAKEYKIKYINLENIITNEYLLNPNDYHFSNKGYQKISEEIIKIIKKEIL